MLARQTIKQQVKNRLVTSLLTSPITYVPCCHYKLIDEILDELCKLSRTGHQLMNLEKLRILEFDQLKNVVRNFETKEVHEIFDGINGLGRWIEYLVFGPQPPTLTEEEPVVCIFKNLFEASAGVQLQSFLLYFASSYRPERGMSVLIVDPLPAASLPPAIRDIVTVVEIPRPSGDDVAEMVASLPVSKACLKREVKLRKTLCRNLQGLELHEVQQIVRSSMLRSNGSLNDSTPFFALEEKRHVLQKSGIIELISATISFDDIGGLNRLRSDIRRSARLYSHLDEVEDSKVPLPKGVLLLGMPGCGKSMIAKATAKEFGVSLLRLDVNRLMGKYVGESEANLRSALSTAEAAHPCVLWIDEIEKAFSGAGSANGESDMLVMRMMGHFLTWMQERKTAVYIVATANDALRSEFMRKGRFDQVYFVDFPGPEERVEILKKKLLVYRKSKYLILDKSLDENSKDVEIMAKEKMDRFAGAEIEYVVKEVMSKKLSQSIENTPDGSELEKVMVASSDFDEIIKDQTDSIMNQKEEKKRQPSINNIQKLYDTYKFPKA